MPLPKPQALRDTIDAGFAETDAARTIDHEFSLRNCVDLHRSRPSDTHA